jgi:hypothetical protein
MLGLDYYGCVTNTHHQLTGVKNTPNLIAWQQKPPTVSVVDSKSLTAKEKGSNRYASLPHKDRWVVVSGF